MPHCTDMEGMQSPEMKQKFTEGPVGILTLKKPGPVPMGGSLVQWFVFALVISYITANVAYALTQVSLAVRMCFASRESWRGWVTLAR